MNDEGEHGGDDTVDDDELQRLSEGLKEAFARVAQSQLAPDEKGRWQQRLIAVTNSAKRDQGRALASLARFNEDWHREFPS